MEIGDTLKEFFVKKILAPQVLKLDVPGYVSGKFYTPEGQNAFTRSIFMPENFFITLEQITTAKLGAEGIQRLYAASKSFGYNFTALNKVPRGNAGLSLDLITKFMEVLYAGKLELNVDIKSKYVELIATELFITRLTGRGESLTIGGYGGVCAYVFDDFKGIDCGILKVGDKYKFICGNEDQLSKAGVGHLKFAGDPPTFDKNYTIFNMPNRKADPSSFSLNKLLESKLFSYQKGELKFSLADIRFAPVELTLSYLLNQNIPDEIIYESAKSAFMEIGGKMGTQQNPHLFLANLLTALGYGNVIVEKKGNSTIFELIGYPWYYGCESSNLPLLKGIIEGFLISQKVTKTNIESLKSSITQNTFKVSVEV